MYWLLVRCITTQRLFCQETTTMMSVPYVWMSTRMVKDSVFFLVSMVGWSCMCIPLQVLGSAAHGCTVIISIAWISSLWQDFLQHSCFFIIIYWLLTIAWWFRATLKSLLSMKKTKANRKTSLNTLAWIWI